MESFRQCIVTGGDNTTTFLLTTHGLSILVFKQAEKQLADAAIELLVAGFSALSLARRTILFRVLTEYFRAFHTPSPALAPCLNILRSALLTQVGRFFQHPLSTTPLPAFKILRCFEHMPKEAIASPATSTVAPALAPPASPSPPLTVSSSIRVKLCECLAELLECLAALPVTHGPQNLKKGYEPLPGLIVPPFIFPYLIIIFASSYGISPPSDTRSLEPTQRAGIRCHNRTTRHTAPAQPPIEEISITIPFDPKIPRIHLLSLHAIKGSLFSLVRQDTAREEAVAFRLPQKTEFLASKRHQLKHCRYMERRRHCHECEERITDWRAARMCPFLRPPPTSSSRPITAL